MEEIARYRVITRTAAMPSRCPSTLGVSQIALEASNVQTQSREILFRTNRPGFVASPQSIANVPRGLGRVL